MNYWTEFGWVLIPKTLVEIGFTLLMCYGSYWLDKRKK
ncbi:conserved protein of unknown function [Pseudodesulfovibrio profundus]|uniref:Uncharacterized protein n=1 Tax=Pseudodesulfovibrio profundus TaxID=57320 RepID=A0A2C8FDJ8_9BACT|nr:conserved protein of unknown function [Pseudodesulfovibrio profundus]|tara:strand:+ start:1961 stop:2074 length:114 start_codon:yes stop_codon:yes gene_type:complete